MLIGINLLYLIPGKVGGTETYARELISAMQKVISDDDQLILFCTRDNSSTFSASSSSRLITLPINASNRVMRLLAEQTLLPLACITHKIDVLFSLGYSAPFFHHCPSVVTIHDLNWYYHPEDFSPLQRHVWKYLTIWSARFSDHIITISHASQDSIQKVMNISTDKITTVLHGSSAIAPVSIKSVNEALSSLGISKPYLFTVLAGYPHKNLITLLKAFKKISIQFPNLSLIICGLSGRADTDNLKYIKDNHLDDRLKILGYVDNSVLKCLYQSAEIFVFPSAYEGFGIPITEAMQSGVPVVSSNAFSLKEVAGNGALLVDPFAVDEYVDAIIKLLSSSKARAEMSKRGYSRVSELKWSSAAQQMLKIASERNKYV